MRKTTLPLGRLCFAAAAALILTIVAILPAWAQDRMHIVAGGENLSAIAQSYGLTLQELSTYNGIANPNVVFVGQKLAIPGSGSAPQTMAPALSNVLPGHDGYYTVVRGETLSSIARAHGMATADLMRLNGISDANQIWVGQQLRVSARVPAVTQPVPQTQASDLQVAEDIYVVQPSDTLETIADKAKTTVQQLLTDNGLPAADFVYPGQRLRVNEAARESTLSAVAAPVNGKKWIEVDLSKQKLTAWQGDVAVMDTYISGGRSATPTVTGRFTIGNKYKAQRMTGPDYDLPGVPWVMYFHSGYAIHGAYWHTNFGAPASHGCVNMRVNEAGMLYEWAPSGTEVYVHY